MPQLPLPQRLSKAGPVAEYLNWLAALGPEMQARAQDARGAVARVLATEDGAILMDLLDKSTAHFFLPPDADPRACDALNAQRFIALDLRRIASNDGSHQPDPRNAKPR